MRTSDIGRYQQLQQREKELVSAISVAPQTTFDIYGHNGCRMLGNIPDTPGAEFRPGRDGWGSPEVDTLRALVKTFLEQRLANVRAEMKRLAALPDEEEGR